jgi:subtilisin family serine protease
VRVYQFRHIRAGAHSTAGIQALSRTISGLRRGAFIVAAALAALVAVPIADADPQPRTEVVVTLAQPPLSAAVQKSRVLSTGTKARRLSLESALSRSYLAGLTRAQDALSRRIERVIPSARVRWRYRVVLDGLAVDLPTDRLGDLSRIAGVAAVYPNTRYRASLYASPELIGADRLWGPTLSTAGQGVKIAVVDQGVDQAHPFFDAAGYTYPSGFPKGNTSFTTPKVIVARSFPPPGATSSLATLPFANAGGVDNHGTHVAGIAAGNYGVDAGIGPGPLSGVAPRAYLGNYKAMTIATPGFGLDGNAPELAAAVEAAVRDGMDVINLSLGEVEIEPARDVLVAALNGAADAGVIPTIAAGNEFDGFGDGSIQSPGSASKAITAAAVTKADFIAPFSSAGPTPVSLAFKPDVSAPGVSILSSVPLRVGTWAQFSGTSMAAPHVAGAAALLRERHPGWSVAQIKSALVTTGDPVYADANRVEVPTTREGGGVIDLPRADNPLVFAQPADLSFGLVKVGAKASRSISLTDAGGGAGAWSASVRLQGSPAGVSVAVPGSITVPGTIQIQATVASKAKEADVTGFVVLQRGDDVRRIPFWFRAESPRLGKPVSVLSKPGVYKGNTRLGKARVRSYRYPEDTSGSGVANNLPGPEQVFRIALRNPGGVANVGAVVIGSGRGVSVSPRIVFPGDENRLLGISALPLVNDPYQAIFGRTEPVVAVIAPSSRAYDLVFDTRGRSAAGSFRFRLWINDRTPPTVSLLTRTIKPRGRLLIATHDGGSGVDPASLSTSIDGNPVRSSYAADQVAIPIGDLPAGSHSLVLSVSDYQETKNMETFGGILPNTRVLRTTFTVS